MPCKSTSCVTEMLLRICALSQCLAIHCNSQTIRLACGYRLVTGIARDSPRSVAADSQWQTWERMRCFQWKAGPTSAWLSLNLKHELDFGLFGLLLAFFRVSILAVCWTAWAKSKSSRGVCAAGSISSFSSRAAAASAAVELTRNLWTQSHCREHVEKDATH